jgi:alkylated DNA repair dioxygenase AlkB
MAGSRVAPERAQARRVETSMQQHALFPADAIPAGSISLPDGLKYQADFITIEEEQALLDIIGTLPFRHSQYRQYTARRRTVNYGAGYDFQHHLRTPAPEIPGFLADLRLRAARWLGIGPETFVQALISEYRPGTPLGWHRDVPDYETIVAVSLVSACRIRFRRYPWDPLERDHIFAIEPQPRSAYALRGDARWKWQHSVPAVKSLRYSITLRTLRHAARRGCDEAQSRS